MEASQQKFHFGSNVREIFKWRSYGDVILYVQGQFEIPNVVLAVLQKLMLNYLKLL